MTTLGRTWLKREPSQHALLRPRTANVVGFVIAATVGVIFLVTTIALTYHSWQRMLKQREVAVRFVAVPATILSSEVVTRRSKSSKTYRNQIRYSYTVDGKTTPRIRSRLIMRVVGRKKPSRSRRSFSRVCR